MTRQVHRSSVDVRMLRRLAAGAFRSPAFLHLTAGAGMLAAFPWLAFGAEGNYEGQCC